jgi:hypothetical protein
MGYLQLLPYAIPVTDVFKTLATCSSKFPVYKKYAQYPVSAHEAMVKEVYKEVLLKESQKGAPYHERIQELLEELPQGVEKTIDGWLNARVKVVETNTLFGVHTAGTDEDKHYIHIPNPISEESKNALNFLALHELRHILNEDASLLYMVCTVVGIAAAVFVHIMNAPIFVSVVTVLAIRDTAKLALSYYREYKADDFAIQYSSVEEVKKAVIAYKRLHQIVQNHVKWWDRLDMYMSHPPMPSRIKRLERAVEEKQKMQLQTA